MIADQIAVAIVRDLAAQPAPLDHDRLGDGECTTCDANVLDGDLQNPATHQPKCVWRRAREAVT